MGNMCCFSSPSPSNFSRSAPTQQKNSSPCCAASASLPSCPDTMASSPPTSPLSTPDAHVITQGDWNGFTRPGWLDPRDPDFDKLAASFYRHQHALLRRLRDLRHGDLSGGRRRRRRSGPGSAAKKVQTSPRCAPTPTPSGCMLGWQQNPLQDLLSSIDTSHVLIAEIEQGRIPRERSRPRVSRRLLALWRPVGVWRTHHHGSAALRLRRSLPQMAARPGSRIVGTAVFTEGLDTNPFAFDLYTEMAWHEDPVDLTPGPTPTRLRRYGAHDPHARRAWQILLKTAYGYRAATATPKVTVTATLRKTPSSTPNPPSPPPTPPPGDPESRATT